MGFVGRARCQRGQRSHVKKGRRSYAKENDARTPKRTTREGGRATHHTRSHHCSAGLASPHSPPVRPAPLVSTSINYWTHSPPPPHGSPPTSPAAASPTSRPAISCTPRRRRRGRSRSARGARFLLRGWASASVLGVRRETKQWEEDCRGWSSAMSGVVMRKDEVV